MEKEKVFAVLGLGMFGQEVCKILSEKGAKVIAIDWEAQLVAKVKDKVTQALLMDTSDEEALRNAGLDEVDVAIVAIRSRIDTSILTTILLKNIGVPYIIARAVSDIHGQVLTQIGATEVINIEISEGRWLAQRVLAPDVAEVIPISDDQSLVEMRIPKSFIGKTVRQLELRKKYNINVISIKRTVTTIDDLGNPKRDELVLSPKPREALKVDDVLVILGMKKDLDRLKEL